MSTVLLGDSSPAFTYDNSFSQFFFPYQITLIASCSFVGLCFIVTAIVVCVRKFGWVDADEEEDRKPLALKAQDRLDAAQWGVKSNVQLLIGLAIFGLSAAAVCSPVTTFPDGTNFYYQERCRGDFCYKFSHASCGSDSLASRSHDSDNGFIAMILAACAGILYIAILVIELSRRCFPDMFFGYDPDDLSNPSKGYFVRWILLLLRIIAFIIHLVSSSFTAMYLSPWLCNGYYSSTVYMLSVGGSIGPGLNCLCIAISLDFIDIWLDGLLNEVGALVVPPAEDEVALKELVVPSPETILPITTTTTTTAINNDDTAHPANNSVSKLDNGSDNLALSHSQMNHPSNDPSGDNDDTKKLIQEQQIALENMKKEMAEHEKLMLALQQKNMQQQQQLPPPPPPPPPPQQQQQQQQQHKQKHEKQKHLPSAQPDAQTQVVVDPNNNHQQHEENNHQHDEQLTEQQKQIQALQQLVEQLQHQINPVNNSTAAVIANPPLPHQPIVNQTVPPQSPSPLILNSVNPLVFSPAAASNDDDDDVCRVDVGGDDHETTGMTRQPKSTKHLHDNAPDSTVALSRREQFDAQQRMIPQLQDEQQALIAKLQAGGEMNNDGDATQPQTK